MDRRQSGAGVPQLIERLRARLGAEAVYGLCLVPEHRPESAWRVAEPTLPATTRNRGRRPKPKCAPTSAEGKPLWLLAEPQLLDGGERPCFEGTLELEQGPERIESGWWDGRDVQRDYYVARNPAGVRLWVFRDRRPPGAGSCMACSAEQPDMRRRPMSYAELHCLTNFSFLRGASHPEELVERAGGARLRGARDHRRMLGGGRRARARRGTRACDCQLDHRQRVPPRRRLSDSCCSRPIARGYGQLCRLITRARRAAAKGSYRLARADLAAPTDAPLATRRPSRSTTVSRCGCPARRPARRTAAGSRASSPSGCGSRSSC